jgi:hypothetical protein
MSYDLRIYFPHEVFPHEEWNAVLSLFNTEEREHSESCHLKVKWVVIAETRTSLKPDGRGQAEREIDPATGQPIWVGGSPVWISLGRVAPIVWGYNVPHGSHWSIHLGTSGGASVKAVWTQFAIPYYALGLIEGLTVQDPQWFYAGDVFCFEDAEEWAEFASIAVPRRAGIGYLVRQGLMSEEGRILF